MFPICSTQNAEPNAEVKFAKWKLFPATKLIAKSERYVSPEPIVSNGLVANAGHNILYNFLDFL